MSDENIAGLTAEELAALQEDDGSGTDTTETTTTEEQPNAEPANEAANGEDAGAAAAAGDTGAAAEPAEPEPAAAAEAEPAAEASAPAQPAPLLSVEAPADADAKLADIAAKKAELLTKFDEGDITTAEYQRDLDVLYKQEREVERALDRAQLAVELERTRAQNEWTAKCNAFMGQTHPEYAKDKTLYDKLDESVRVVATMPSMRDATPEQILDKAHKLVLLDHADKFAAPAPAKPAAQPKAPKPEAIPSLHNVPSAEVESTSGGKFAALDRLNGLELEAALSKLSPAEREQYMASA